MGANPVIVTLRTFLRNWTITQSVLRECIGGLDYLNTIFLSDEVVDAYLKDLRERLEGLKEEMPTVWCPIGVSGGSIARAALKRADDLKNQIIGVPVAYDRTTEEISFPGEADPSSFIKGKRILLLDGSVHSGKTFRQAYLAIEKMKPLEISSYSLVVRAGASILPNYFSVMIGDYDRALFLKKTFPNNLLFTYGCVRKLADADQALPKISCEKDFIDKFSWGDLIYEMRVDPRRQTYVYEHQGKIKGFVNLRIIPGDDILVDIIAVDRKCKKQGIGGNLMRWAETCGRNNHCATIRLWAVDDRKEWYSDKGYEFCNDKPLVLDGITFHLMRKKLLYNLPDDNVMTMGI